MLLIFDVRSTFAGLVRDLDKIVHKAMVQPKGQPIVIAIENEVVANGLERETRGNEMNPTSEQPVAIILTTRSAFSK